VILWSSRKVEQALAQGRLDSWTKVKYLLIPTVLGALSGPFYILRPVYGQKPPSDYTYFSLISSIITACVTYWGIKTCFRVNSSIDGRNFFERFAVLSLPILIRVMTVAITCGIVLLLFIGHPKNRDPIFLERVGITFAVAHPIIAYIVYSMLINSFERLGRWLERETPAGS
jgi:hypothetical protein